MNHYQFKTTICVADTEVELSVEFDFFPEEKQTFYYPGAKASIEITSAKSGQIEVQDWVFNCISQQLNDDAWEYLKNQKESARQDRADYLYEQQKERRHAA